VGFVECALVHEHGGKGQARGLDHGDRLGAEAAAGDHDARQDAGAFRRIEGIGDCGHGSLQRNLVCLRNDCRGGCAADDREVRGIEGKRHIDRAAVIEGRCDQPLGLSDAVVRGHDRSCTDHRLGYLVEQIELAVAQRVVNAAMRRLHCAGRHADQMEYRQVLGISAGDAVDRAELAHAVGGAECGHAAMRA